MAPNTHLPRTHRFTIRLWSEQLDDDACEWRGRLHSTDTGETRYFRDAATLYQAMLAILSDAESELSVHEET